MSKHVLCTLLAICLVASLAGCGKDKPEEEVVSSSESSMTVEKFDVHMGSITPGDTDKDTESDANKVNPDESSGEDTTGKDTHGSGVTNSIPNTPETDSMVNTHATKERVETTEYQGLKLPMFFNWTGYPMEGDRYFCGGMGECYTVEPTQKYEVNSSIFSMYFGTTANYARMETAVVDSKTAVGVVYINEGDVPYMVGTIYTLLGDQPLLFKIENYSLNQDELWDFVWSVAKGIGVEVQDKVPLSIAKGKQKYTPAEKLDWQSSGTYNLPKMNLSTREDISYQLPSNWKLVEINGVVSSNSENGHLVFEMSRYNSEKKLSAEFGNYIARYVNNNQGVNRLKTFVVTDGMGEAIAVKDRVQLIKLYSTGSVAYRCIITYDAKVASDEEKWLANKIYEGITFVMPEGSSLEETPSQGESSKYQDNTEFQGDGESEYVDPWADPTLE